MALGHALALPALERLHADLLALEVALLARPGLCGASTPAAVCSCTPELPATQLTKGCHHSPILRQTCSLSSTADCRIIQASSAREKAWRSGARHRVVVTCESTGAAVPVMALQRAAVPAGQEAAAEAGAGPSGSPAPALRLCLAAIACRGHLQWQPSLAKYCSMSLAGRVLARTLRL